MAFERKLLRDWNGNRVLTARKINIYFLNSLLNYVIYNTRIFET